jgi:hypothetical protein
MILSFLIMVNPPLEPTLIRTSLVVLLFLDEVVDRNEKYPLPRLFTICELLLTRSLPIDTILHMASLPIHQRKALAVISKLPFDPLEPLAPALQLQAVWAGCNFHHLLIRLLVLDWLLLMLYPLRLDLV